MSFGIATAYRIEIEGLGAEAVTDPEMEQALADGRQRVRGLRRDGMQIEESVDVALAEIEASPLSIAIVDRQSDDFWTQWLSWQPQTKTWLTANASESATSLTVLSTAGISAGDVVHLGTEAILVASVTNSTTLNVTGGRGYWGTTAQAHYAADGAELATPVLTVTRPQSLEGRRVSLYRYILGTHDLQGDGEQVWAGVLVTDAQLGDGSHTWALRADPSPKLWQVDLGTDLDEVLQPRGIFYPRQAPFIMRLVEAEGPDREDLAARAQFITLIGHYETQQDFVADINDAIDLTGWEAADVRAVVLEDSGRWGLKFTAGATPRWVSVVFEGDAVNLEGEMEPVPGSANTVAAGDEIVLQAGARGTLGAATVPRGVFGGAGRTGASTPDGVDPLDVDSNSLYLSAPVVWEPSATTSDALTIQWSEDVGTTAPLFDVDSASRRVTLEGRVRAVIYYTSVQVPEIRRLRRWAVGTFADFLSALIVESPGLANLGASPLLTTADLSPSSTVIEDAAASVSALANRTYDGSQAVDLAELIANECRLLGVFPAMGASGRVEFKRLRLPSTVSRADFDLDDSTILVDDDLPTWKRNAYGSINVMSFASGYDYREDEHTGPTVTIRDVYALSSSRRPQELKVEPYSRGTGLPELSYDEAVRVADRVFGIFGRPYSTLEMDVPPFDANGTNLLTTALCGSIARITTHRIPNVRTGRRGVSGLRGLVIGRSWDLSGRGERGKLTVLVSDEGIAGYSPSVRITSVSFVSGRRWELDVDFTDPAGVASTAPAGSALSDFYAVGDRVEMLTWDDLTQSPEPGTILGVQSGSLVVEFDSTLTSGDFSGTRYLEFTAADDVSESQEGFAYMAPDDGELDFSGGGQPAKVFS